MIRPDVPVVLVAEGLWTVCRQCGATWSGPHKDPVDAGYVADAANSDPLYELPVPARDSGPCCERSDPEPEQGDISGWWRPLVAPAAVAIFATVMVMLL